MVHELVVNTVSGEHLATIEFEDDEWEEIVQIAVGDLVNKAVKNFLKDHKDGKPMGST